MNLPGQPPAKAPKTHKCAAIGCLKIVPTSLLMCGRHWKMVPPELQSLVWRTYTRGQEKKGIAAATPAYLEAMHKAIDAVARKEGKVHVAELASGLGISEADARGLFDAALGDEPRREVPGAPGRTPYDAD